MGGLTCKVGVSVGESVGITEGVELGGFDNATDGSPVRGRIRIQVSHKFPLRN